MSAHVVEADAHPGYVGTACLLSSSFSDSSKDYGVVTLPIMGRNSRQTIGKVRGEKRPEPCHSSLLRSCSFSLSGSPVSVDYLVIRPIQGLQCDMSSCFVKHWKKRSTVDVGHRGAGSSHAAKWVMNKGSRGAAFTFNISSPLTSCLAFSRHHRIRENTIASFQSAAKHVGLTTNITHWLWKLCSCLWLSWSRRRLTNLFGLEGK